MKGQRMHSIEFQWLTTTEADLDLTDNHKVCSAIY